MTVKIIDMAWIADKALDLYCSEIYTSVQTSILQKSKTTKNVKRSVMKIFNSVFDLTIDEFEKRYDRVYIIVSCYPITRMRQASIMTRFICTDSEFLSEIGVSIVQFQEFFEKFINLKCKNEFITDISEKTKIFNGCGILFSDWKNAIIARYGTSLIDDRKELLFASNPNVIKNMEYNDHSFTEISKELKYKIEKSLSFLT